MEAFRKFNLNCAHISNLQFNYKIILLLIRSIVLPTIINGFCRCCHSEIFILLCTITQLHTFNRSIGTYYGQTL